MLKVVKFDMKTLSEQAGGHFDEDTGKEQAHRFRTARRCADKVQLKAIGRHVTALGGQLMVIEDPYVDRDFLEDYSAYYVKSFPHYPRYCRRIHFFGHPVTEQTIQDFLNTEGKGIVDAMKTGYLGFTVLRPLPGTFVGRTCLRPQPDGSKRIHQMFLRPYEVNLAGRTLTVDSLAFQEQDRAVAACATSAVWTALHKAGHKFGIKVPTPSEITNLAMRDGPRRGLPSAGLTVEEISHSIRRSGLEVEVRENVTDLKGFLHAYGQFGLPIILGVGLFEEDAKGKRTILGPHAVTVTGFAVNDGGPAGLLFAERITGLYFHDDQAGPFCHGDLKQVDEFDPEGNPVQRWILNSEFPCTPGSKARGYVLSATIPLDEMVRIQYEDAQRMAAEFNHLLLPIMPAGKTLEWDIRLADVNHIRERIGRALTGPQRQRLLGRNLPRFVWRITARFDGKEIFDLLLDGTDIFRSFFVCDLIVHDSGLVKALKAYVAVQPNRDSIMATTEWGPEWLKLLDGV